MGGPDGFTDPENFSERLAQPLLDARDVHGGEGVRDPGLPARRRVADRMVLVQGAPRRALLGEAAPGAGEVLTGGTLALGAPPAKWADRL